MSNNFGEINSKFRYPAFNKIPLHEFVSTFYKNFQVENPDVAHEKYIEEWENDWGLLDEHLSNNSDNKDLFNRLVKVSIGEIACKAVPEMANKLGLEVFDLEFVDKTRGYEAGFILKEKTTDFYCKVICAWQDALVSLFLARLGVFPAFGFIFIPKEKLAYMNEYSLRLIHLHEVTDFNFYPLNRVCSFYNFPVGFTTGIDGVYSKNNVKREKTFTTWWALDERDLDQTFESLDLERFFTVVLLQYIFDLSDILNNPENIGFVKKTTDLDTSNLSAEPAKARLCVVDFASPKKANISLDWPSHILDHEQVPQYTISALVTALLRSTLNKIEQRCEKKDGYYPWPIIKPILLKIIALISKLSAENPPALEEICNKALGRILTPRLRVYDEESKRYLCTQETTSFEAVLDEVIAVINSGAQFEECSLIDWEPEEGRLEDAVEAYKADILERLARVRAMAKSPCRR